MSPDFFYHSAEIRWFMPEQGQQKQILGWFVDQLPLIIEKEPYVPRPEAGPFVKQERERTDEYLLFPVSDTASVKQRQGKLEVKTLVAGPRPFSMSSGGAIGRIDQWIKWSFEPSDDKEFRDRLKTEFGQSGPWCKVEKIRYLQKYSFDSGSLVAVSPDKLPDTGCGIELTAINIQANLGSWLTFGFEAFGPPGRVMAILDEMVEHFFKVHGQAPVQLDGRDSLSYPAWLAILR